MMMKTLAFFLLLSPSLVRAESFAGLWDTSFGRLKLIEDGGKITGLYAYAGGGTLEGKNNGASLTLRYVDVANGDAEFTLTEEGRAFSGRWRADGEKEWKPWNGVRVLPQPNRRWLYVIESRWEERLTDREYTYGQMLRTFFDRAEDVQVRQRFFSDRASLLKWLREASYLAEPVVVYISSHGSPEGVASDSGSVGGKDIAEALKSASTILLLHFGACEVMKGGVAKEIQSLIPKPYRFPISGFTASVDWAGSAIADMMYLDLILARGFTPAKAAAETARLLPYTRGTGNDPIVGPIGFKLVP